MSLVDLTQKTKAVTQATDFLKNDRKRFLILSLGKFSLPDTLDLSKENITEVSKEEELLLIGRQSGEEKASAYHPFGTTWQEFNAVSSSHTMAQQVEDDDLAAAAQQLLIAAYGQEYKTEQQSIDPKSTEGRILYLTNCLWRYLPLRKMTTYHLWAILTCLTAAKKADTNSIVQQRKVFPELVKALGVVARDTQYDGNDLEQCSAVVQILAALPEYGHGEAVPEETVDISLEALTAFSLVPRVVESKDDLTSKAADLAMLLEGINDADVRQGSGDREKANKAAFDRMVIFEKDGATASAVLLRRHCFDMVGGSGSGGGSEGSGGSGGIGSLNMSTTVFTDSELGERSSALLSVLSKMSHDTDLLCSTAPLVFESILRAMHGKGEGSNGVALSPEEISSLAVILASLPKESDAYHLGAELMQHAWSSASYETTVSVIQTLLADISDSHNENACIALASLLSSGTIQVDDLVNAGGVGIILATLTDSHTNGWDNGSSRVPKELLQISYALTSTNAGMEQIQSANGGIPTLIECLIESVQKDEQSESMTMLAMEMSAVVRMGKFELMGPGTHDSYT